MKTNKVTILTVATLATLALANNAKADAQDSPVSSQEAPTALVTNPEGNNTTEAKQPTEITKEGTEITVKNPEVVIDQSNGTGKYQEFSVEYKNIKFADDMPINQGDKVTMTFPEELNFQTKYEFDVKNPEDAVVGKASTNPEDRTVTTVFNDYFAAHPLNKQMSLKLDAKWTDKVESGKPVNVNFNGTVVTANIGKEQVIGKDELIAKWGSQDKDDPTVINWTARINYAKRVLNYVTIIDEMSENQKLVDNYFEIKNIESLDPWIDKGSAMDLVKSISKSDHGFTIKMDRLDHMLYINYKTKLVNAVKDSVNPTNKIELKAETDGATSYSYVQLVGGKGDASGENKPVWEIPNDAPKYEKPEININDIPLMPPAPILEKPYLPIEDIPLLPPAPILEKPYLPIEDIPLMPPAPILDKPEYPIPAEPEKPNTPPSVPEIPVTPKEEPKVPSESPKVEPKKEEVKVENKGEVSHETPVETYKAPMLPQTGSQAGVALSVLGLTVLSLTVAFKKKEN
jgi:LPXTG-motif cell wall-anchored protein|nr:MAG TPA: putative outer membrane protein [Caudoviricetes sp.]